MYDIIIKNGDIIDGSGKTPRTPFDLAIKQDEIALIAKNIPAAKGKVVIDATGQIISPGFIDIQNHSDSYWTLFDQPSQLSLLSQGITTIVIGNCGSSLAPLPTAESIKTIQKWHDLSGVNINWSTFGELLSVLAGKTSVNVASLVGHSTLRRGLLADSVRKATGDEILIMNNLLTDALNEGAFGLSLGLVYAHEINSSLAEIESLAECVKKANGFLSVHLRSEGGQILDALDEVIGLASKLSLPLKISHLKIREQKNWQLKDRVLAKIEEAFHRGVKVSFDMYPYDSSWSVLYTYLPKWVYEGGRTEILRLIHDVNQRRKILEYLRSQNYDYQNIVVATSENNNGFIGKTLAQIALNSNTTNEEALLNVLKTCSTAAIVFDKNLSQKQVEEYLSSPLSMVATDGAGYTDVSNQLVHPRCFGAMPKFLSWVRDQKFISFEEAIRKITSEPAKLLGISDRGEISKGVIADLVVWDPQEIVDKATYENPHQLSAGINHVFVNGKLGYQNRTVQGLYGKMLRKT